MAKSTRVIELVAAPCDWEIEPGRTVRGWAYNGQVPGPAITARVGDELAIRLTNRLPEPTTIHWHGLRIPAAMDGTELVQPVVQPGETFEYRFTVPDAGTFWYHPHTNEPVQMERGLYGAIVVSGADDPPVDAERVLVFDDLRLDRHGRIAPAGGLLERHNGREGKVRLLNGRVEPSLTMAAGQVERWRLLNAASARYVRFWLGGRVFRIIGSDGGLLTAPVEATEVLLTPGDRCDIVVGPFEPGTELSIESLPYNRGIGKPRAQRFGRVRVVGPRAGSAASIPATLRRIERLASATSSPTRTVRLGGRMRLRGGVEFLVNGETHPHDSPVPVGELQVWDIVNETPMDHPFHLHGFFFQVLAVNGVEPDVLAWEDTVNVPARGTVRIAWLPDDRPGSWMYHCHILEHAATGMMSHFQVVDTDGVAPPSLVASCHGTHGGAPSAHAADGTPTGRNPRGGHERGDGRGAAAGWRRWGRRLGRLAVVALAMVAPPLVVGGVNGWLNLSSMLTPPPAAPDAPLPAVPPHDPSLPTAVVLLDEGQTEATDFLAPYAILAASGRYNVYAVAPERRVVPLFPGGIDVLPHLSFADYERHVGTAPALIVLPFMPAPAQGKDDRVAQWVARSWSSGTTLLTICGGSMIAAQAGLIDGRPATSHESVLRVMRERRPQVRWTAGVRYVDDGDLITSAGVTSGIDATLHLLARDHGADLARDVARRLGYTHTQYLTEPRFSLEAGGGIAPLLNLAFRRPAAYALALFDGADELEVAAIVDTYPRSLAALSYTTAPGRRYVETRFGLHLVPRYDFAGVPRPDRVLITGEAGTLGAAALNALVARSDLETAERLDAGRFSYDVALLDMARAESAAAAREAARMLEYPTSHLAIGRAGFPVRTLLRPLGLAMAGLMLLAVLARIRRLSTKRQIS